MKLTEQQLRHFKTFGFVTFRQLLSPEEMEIYNREFDRGLQAWAQHGRHAETYGPCVPLHDSDTPFIASLLDDPRFADVAEQVLGTKVLGIWSDASRRVADTPWHTDQVTSKYKAVKFAIYPDPLISSNGALRVIPGSHHETYSTRINEHTGSVATEAREGVSQADLPAYVLESQPGDVLLFHNPTWHASFGGGERRRMGVVMFTEDPQTPYATGNLQRIMFNMHRRVSENYGRPFYPEYWRSIDDSRHQHWVKRLAELESLETPPASAYEDTPNTQPYPVAESKRQ